MTTSDPAHFCRHCHNGTEVDDVGFRALAGWVFCRACCERMVAERTTPPVSARLIADINVEEQSLVLRSFGKEVE